ncbi:IclR family protein transcriptional regulator [Listeria floridensis FSL S10-1187]|uniref:IclR family protein transcriptional regulator n=1 Tax=Listeria floridensis FSL S10-1187 TaxID=1265817 RepID=A0ABP3AW91_9LIST|nr:IclR family transcriptional regulator [Listeria floridensis]EUJ26760.1 IclR family protein transcriptional regulator [Listeria floridensis FSL S10-1187]
MTQELRSVKNALTILKCFSPEKNTLGVTEISNMTGLAKSTVSRTLATLAQEGFVRKATDQQSYILGFAIINLAGISLSSMRIQQEVSPALSQLVVHTNESGHIAILDGMDIIYIQKAESSIHTKMKTHLGSRNPAHATSSGKLLLAYQGDQTVAGLSENPLPAYTSETITNPYKLKEELETIRQNRFAYSKDELTEGVSSVAVPVIDYTGIVVASIALVGATARFTPKKISEFASLLKQAARESSHNLGYSH